MHSTLQPIAFRAALSASPACDPITPATPECWTVEKAASSMADPTPARAAVLGTAVLLARILKPLGMRYRCTSGLAKVDQPLASVTMLQGLPQAWE